MNKLQNLSYQIRLNYFNNMDFTDYPSSKRSKDQNQQGEDNAEMFYSMSNDYQLNEQAMEQFTNLTNFINSTANSSYPVLELTEEQKEMYLQTSRKQKQNNAKQSKKQQCNQKPVVGEKYRNSSSSEEFQCKQLSPPSPNKVSLLESSLKLSKPILADEKGKGENFQLIAPQKPIQEIKVFDNSLHKTQLSEQIPVLPSLSITITQKSQSKQSNQSSESREIAKMKILQHINKTSSNNDGTVKMFRIQKPDDVYEELEREKQKQAQKQKEKKKEVEKIKNKVQQNIANAKYLINQVKPQVVKKHTLILSSPIKKDQKSFTLGQIPNILKQQQFNWKCLVRLPQLTNLASEQSQTQTENLYNRHQFTLTKTHIKFQKEFQINYTNIYKIKIIYTEYNRPELKITFDDETNPNKKNKDKDNDNDRDKDKIIYFCDSYEVIYAIFAWVIVGKLITLGKSIFGGQVSGSSTAKKMVTTFDYALEGIIYKKSQFLKNWEKRYVKISNFFLKSYRITQSSPTKSQTQYRASQTESYKISTQCTFELEQIKEIWTRFEFIENKYLVMKMFKKNKLQKYQLAIPTNNFCEIYPEADRKKYQPNWLVALVGILKGEI